ncbi:carboxymuconolactone decarboxylase family protein [Flexivirga caeni]|uniref:Carboxymuconolactone decarboxylase family protein n=1 Tax=Flexivirga caeni TaxID=2294115 RepID=A0A3M9M973_9MICO|nr:carboxymuconolactone decarboxylase family protein [Flexivirga caeni]RNI21413.1 carboxymuconolactone decarboxylase family protein [Flexivirga caeni]
MTRAGQRVPPGTWRTNGPLAAGFASLAGRVTHTAPPAVFTVLGRGRRTFWGWLGFAATLMPFGSLDRCDGELVILRVALLRGSDYEIAHHERIARRAGLSADQVEQVVGATPESSYFSERQRALIAATDELIADDDLSDGTWTLLHDHLGDRGSVEFLLLAGQYRMLATTLHALRIGPDPTE